MINLRDAMMDEVMINWLDNKRHESVKNRQSFMVDYSWTEKLLKVGKLNNDMLSWNVYLNLQFNFFPVVSNKNW